MATYATYKGARLDLETYQGKSSIEYDIEVQNDDETAADLSIYSSIVTKLLYRQHGEEILSPTTTETDSVVYITYTKAQTLALQTREYWYETYGILIDPVDEQELIAYGILKNV